MNGDSRNLQQKLDENNRNIEELKKKHKHVFIIQIIVGVLTVITLTSASFILLIPLIVVLQKRKSSYALKIKNITDEILALRNKVQVFEGQMYGDHEVFKGDSISDVDVISNEIKCEPTIEQSIVTPSNQKTVKIRQSDLYLKLFKRVNRYDLKKEISPDFLKTIKRSKDIEYERFMKVSNTRERPYCFVVFDLETTGLNHQTKEIIEIGAIRFVDNVPTEAFHTYVKPKKKITQKITSINGITNEMVSEYPPIEDVLPCFMDFVQNDVLIAHNAPFDMAFILQKLYDNGYRKPKNKVIDTLTLARQKIRDLDFETSRNIKLTSYKLENLKYDFGLWDIGSHNALDDCKVCAFVYQKIAAEYGDVCYIGDDYVTVDAKVIADLEL